MIGYVCKSLQIISLVSPTRLIFLAMGEVLNFGFNLAVCFPSDSRGSDTSILHHAFISIFIALWAVITHYVTIRMPILSYFTRFT